MARLHGKDLQAIYPEQKSYDQLQDEKDKISEIRRPKLVNLKVSALVGTAILSVYLAYRLIATIMSGSLSSSESVIFGVVASTAVVGVTFGLVYYMCTQISSLVNRVFASTRALYGSIFVTILASGGLINLLYDSFGFVSAAIYTSIACFAVTYCVCWFISRIQNR